MNNYSGYSRFIYAALSGLLLTASTTAWNSLGYLNPYAWALEWGDVALAFLCIFFATKTFLFKNKIVLYTLIGAALLLSAFSTYSFFVLPFFQGMSHFYVYAYAIPAFPIAILIFAVYRGYGNQKFLSFIFFIIISSFLMAAIILFAVTSAVFPTDESAFDLYSAHLFLQGLNPYNPAFASGAFSFLHFPLNADSPITPLTTGGMVNSITYPALSFLIFIPAVVLNLKSSLIMIPFFIIPMFLPWYKAWSTRSWLASSLVLIPFVSLFIYTYQGTSADTDIVWASLLMLSYYVLPKSKVSGIFFGIALSVKQLPIISGPFMFYFIYREYGLKRSVAWLCYALLSFLALNAYFILLSPADFINSILENEFAPLLGVGYGLSQLSFLGIIPIPRTIFTILMIFTMLLFFMAYVFYFQKMKYALFTFPVLIFFLNYRVFAQYLYYWMILSLIPVLDLLQVNRQYRSAPVTGTTPAYDVKVKVHKVFAMLIAVLIVFSAFGIYSQIQHSEQNRFLINSVSFESYNNTGYVNKISVNITYVSGEPNETHVLFRIIPAGPVVNANMLLWIAENNTILNSGRPININIIPQYSQYAVSLDSNFIIIAYFGDIQGSYNYSPY